jgi:hypothetical protein
MAIHNSYFPPRKGDQIIWLNNFSSKIGNYQAALNYTADEIAAIVADCQYSAYLLDTWQHLTRSFADSGTAAVEEALYTGTGTTPVTLPTFDVPTKPTPPTAVAPGAVKRVFAFVKNLKTRPGDTAAIEADLGVVGAETEERPADAVPQPKGEARSGEVVVSFKKMGHMGVFIEGQLGNETDWTFLAIDTTNPYNDTRPLKLPNQPEQRRYRLCYWNGAPTNNWSNTVAVTFGG